VSLCGETTKDHYREEHREPLVECLLSVLYSSMNTATARLACSRVAKWRRLSSSNSRVELNDSETAFVQGRTGASHGLGDAGAAAGVREQVAGVLTALVGVEQHPGHGAATDRDGHAQRRAGQLGVVVDAHGEPDTAPANADPAPQRAGVCLHRWGFR
jgi:hypothetical protein